MPAVDLYPLEARSEKEAGGMSLGVNWREDEITVCNWVDNADRALGETAASLYLAM